MPTSLRRFDEPGHCHFWTISCYRRLAFFRNDVMKLVVIDALEALRARFRVCLISYVIMPEHIHVVWYPHAPGNGELVSISKLLHAFKQHVGFHGKQCLRDIWHRHGRLWSSPLNEWANGRMPKQTIMSTRGYDFNIDRQETLLEKIDYCHKNPITRSLVDRPEDWQWSSYRYYELEDDSLLAMDWDGRWPIEW
jgi:putative transposase